MLLFLLFISCAFSSLIQSKKLQNAVKFRDCGSSGMSVQSVEVTPCAVQPCELFHGQNYSISVDFTSESEDFVSFKLCGQLGPVCIPFPTGVKNFNVASGVNKFRYSMPILSSYPNIKVVGKFEFTGQNKACFMIPLKIMPSSKSEESVFRLENILPGLDSLSRKQSSDHHDDGDERL